MATSASNTKGMSATEAKFLRLGLVTPQDFILHLPIRYEDETEIREIAHLRAGERAQIEATVIDSEVRYQPRRQLSANVRDDSGSIALRWMTFYPSQRQQMQTGRRWRICGEVRSGFHGLEMIHPKMTAPSSPLPAALTPIYSTTDGLAQTSLRQAISSALKQADLTDTLPSALVHKLGLISFAEAIGILHAPAPTQEPQALIERHHPAWLRIKFDELLAQQLSLAAARDSRRAKRSRALVVRDSPDSLVNRLIASLPFDLTHSQRAVIAEISQDLTRCFPMYRLLQGDVGSGKTIVAAIAALQAIEAGVQVAIMAPTEILAQQHVDKMRVWCEPLGVEICWLTGSMSTKNRKISHDAIRSGQARLIIGTQALIQESVHFNELGLIIVDEQHRFGVSQRLSLSRKGEGTNESISAGAPFVQDELIPHQLTMSATPIPRTLAMTFYADLEVSSIIGLPPGRSAVTTKLVSDARRLEIIAHVAQAAQQGHQTYWVCPLIEESEALELQTAVDTHRDLCEALPDLNVGLVHGRLTNAEKAATMHDFREGRIHVLVATTVIEVGVDVPNASLMVIEHAERFGLAQLHQLRGRVGRGHASSVCVLMYQPPLSLVARQRLRAMYETQDGFEIAQRDLDLRGPGELLGSRQSGVALLRFADLAQDGGLVQTARETAMQLRKAHVDIVDAHLKRWMRGREDFLRS
jgi:ATP-dependent DNA helicase RecG